MKRKFLLKPIFGSAIKRHETKLARRPWWAWLL